MVGLFSGPSRTVKAFAFGYKHGLKSIQLMVVEDEDGEPWLLRNELERIPRGTVCVRVDLDGHDRMNVGGETHKLEVYQLFTPDESVPGEVQALPEYIPHELPLWEVDDEENPSVVPLPLDRDLEGVECPECGERNPERALRCVECNVVVDGRVRELKA